MAYELKFTPRFKRAYKKLNAKNKEAVKAALKVLAKGSPYPNSLRVKKMKGYKNPSVHEASPTMDIRITFEFDNPDYIVLRNVGEHDSTLNNP